ncbi:MAG: geranylgeranylglycerol-phosphate geranylgeranyltransferase [Lewinella sp.]|nr:geranylgeranylglycerol-phosphate geranylgeranyltransferase [Lewinella sp.]
MAVFRLIRFPNLFVIAVTQWLIYDHVFGQAYEGLGLSPVLEPLEALLLIAATLFVAAGGYIVNDLEDWEIDLINRRKESVIVGRVISEGSVRWLYFCCVAAGFFCSLLLAIWQHKLQLLWLYPVTALLLAWYPRYLKRSPWVGNVLVALFCAGTAGLVWLAEWDQWVQMGQLHAPQQARVSQVLMVFMLYAFLATWIRELIKDLEDEVGDREQGRRTFPIIFGRSWAHRFITGMGLLLIAALLGPVLLRWDGFLNLPVFALAVSLVGWVLILLWRLRMPPTVKLYGILSMHWKFFLLGGLFLLFLYQL